MKTTALRHLPSKTISFVSACLLAAGSAHAQLLTDITALSSVRTSGSYTYYAQQTAGSSSYFTTAFYPGPPNHDGAANTSDRDGTLNDATSTATSISIGSGELTDYSGGLPTNSTGVSGWVGTTSYLGTSTSANPGTFDILFDLGGVYDNISQIVVNYTDSAGHRFVITNSAQSIYFGLTPPNNTSTGGMSLFGTSTILANGTAANMTFDSLNPISARYIDLRLAVNVAGAGNFGSVGGYINSVQILAIPEPSTMALIFLLAPVLWIIRRSRSQSAN